MIELPHISVTKKTKSLILGGVVGLVAMAASVFLISLCAEALFNTKMGPAAKEVTGHGDNERGGKIRQCLAEQGYLNPEVLGKKPDAYLGFEPNTLDGANSFIILRVYVDDGNRAPMVKTFLVNNYDTACKTELSSTEAANAKGSAKRFTDACERCSKQAGYFPTPGGVN